MARSIIIGDVHGCAVELAELLEAVAATKDDQIYFVGDLINRGPDPLGVLRIVREVRGKAVLGNHEQRVLKARAAQLANTNWPHGNPAIVKLVEQLKDADWELLHTLPLHLQLSEHGVRIVHAGIVPGVAFQKQDPWVLTHIRCIDGKGNASDRWDATPWGKLHKGPEHIVFGHAARRLPQFWPFASGIDTGCVYGGALSALVLRAREPVPPPETRSAALVSVPAHQAYSDYSGGLPG